AHDVSAARRPRPGRHRDRPLRLRPCRRGVRLERGRRVRRVELGVGRLRAGGRGVHPRLDGDPVPRDADHRHRLAGVRALVRRRRPHQRQGLRVRRGLCGRGAARLHRGPGHVGDGAVQQGRPARRQGLRLRRQPGLHHRGAQERGRLLQRLLRRPADRHHHRGQRHRRRDVPHRARRRQAGCPGRHHQPHRHRGAGPAVGGSRCLRHQRPGGAVVAERTDRRHRRRPPDRLLHDRGAARRRCDRRSAPAARGSRGRAVRRRARQGQPAHRLRQPGGRHAPRGRDPRPDRRPVAGAAGRARALL
ncbi:MAG: ABC transporter, substrate-binding protein (cluster 3, basic aa/glutamine/opines), partial [uncultured Nocardioides sp.]